MSISPLVRTLGITAATVLSICITLVIGLFYFPDSACGNDLLAERVSPDQKLKAVVFQRDCGATTGFSTQVSILSTNSKIGSSSGNVFSSDTDHGAAPAGPGGGPEVNIKWESERILLISHHQAARVFKAEQETKSVKIKYEKTPQ